MKRIFIILLTLSLILSLCACQPTPEKGVVGQKDSERMIENAQKTDKTESSDKSLAEQYGIPEEYKYETQGKDGKLNIKVDAQVVVPDKSAMPIYRVRAADFTQEQVDAFWNVFCDGLAMWEISDVLSKSDIENMIIERKRLLEQSPGATDSFKQNIISELEEALKAAPETVERNRADGRLSPKSLYTDLAATQKIADYMGVNAYGEGIEFSVSNNNDLKETITKADTPGMSSMISPVRAATIQYINDNNSAYKNRRVGFGYSPSIPIMQDSDVDAKMLEKVGITPSEAKLLVQDLLDKTNSGMAVDSIYFQDDEQFGHEDFIVRPAENWAYRILCVREMDGIPCAYMSGTSNAGIDAMAPSWAYEQMEFLVNSEGIFKMNWIAPLEITETVNQDAQLLPFSEIIKVFEKIMMIKYESIPEWLEDRDFEIDRITLSLQRVAEQDSPENGLLIPAWNFYGKRIDRQKGGSVTEDISTSFLSINAIDGSIIDPGKGY